MLDSKRILENIIAIFFAFLPMMFLMGLVWFFVITDADRGRYCLAEYREIAANQNNIISQQQEEIKELQDFSHPNLIFKSEVEQDNWIEILRTQVNQLKPTN